MVPQYNLSLNYIFSKHTGENAARTAQRPRRDRKPQPGGAVEPRGGGGGDAVRTPVYRERSRDRTTAAAAAAAA
ncbi:hypothetical protein JYU34_002054 [Plutella xylostella]|uniref:Uncharacterized protein n=1 Tax=Plutella xylostella TaxID=51655 RepID=A0ABQ7R5E9_PLUXY|nr:hypothetical protein JYU34_002054 [Plutella xylostella]